MSGRSWTWAGRTGQRGDGDGRQRREGGAPEELHDADGDDGDDVD